jgi:hypothetical protein
MTEPLLARLQAYVKPGAVSISTADSAYLEGCLEEAQALVNNFCGITGALFEPVTLTYTDGSTVVLSRDGDIVTAAIKRITTSSGPALAIPTGFAPAGAVDVNMNNRAHAYGRTFPSNPGTLSLSGPVHTGTYTYTGEASTALVNPHNVPEAILNRAYIEVASELYNRQSAPNGISQFASPDGSPIRIRRDPMAAVYELLRPFLPGGFA